MRRSLTVIALLMSFAVIGSSRAIPRNMDADLLEVSIPTLHRYYIEHRYTVRAVVDWHLARIHRYNDIYRAVEQVFEADARAQADTLDAQLRAGQTPTGVLWGVPMMIKANTSIKGTVTSAGWSGYTLQGHELIAPKDAPIVSRLKAAGAILLGHSNMPDLANSDTNRSSAFGRTGNAYDPRYSPGGSSGGTVTSVTGNFAVAGTGTDTGNSIRMPAATSALVGVFPTRGRVSIAGIAPLDWLLDNTGPITRTVEDAALILGVMAGADSDDPVTAEATGHEEARGFTQYLDRHALQGKRFGVPAFILNGTGIPFHGVPAQVPSAIADQRQADAAMPLHPATRRVFEHALEELRAMGATVVIVDELEEAFAKSATQIATYPYVREGTDRFLAHFGPADYHSVADYERVTGQPGFAGVTGEEAANRDFGAVTLHQALIDSDPAYAANVLNPRERTRKLYDEALDRLHLDGLVYPAIQMPPMDETLPQDGRLSEGPHSLTGWVNMIGVPAVVVPGGWYANGLPFGLEFSAQRWKDGELLGWAYAYEQATHHRRSPTLLTEGVVSGEP
jgi:Asp-tRNA(Asn)/Glu-tRNA(Gln) amidotransferase A subunit family amidase